MPVFHDLKQGRFLGEGIARDVNALGNRYVIKRLQNRYDPDNRNEIILWNAVKDTPDARFFCPIIAAADDARWVIQPRCTILNRTYEYPAEEVDKAFDVATIWGVRDLHLGNFGILPDGRVVVTDYGAQRPWVVQDPDSKRRLESSKRKFSRRFSPAEE